MAVKTKMKGIEQSAPQRDAYVGIDIFRIVAALLVVAVHTFPLASFSQTADFILVRIIGRLAVPFFFMTSGFFLIKRDTPAKKLGVFLWRSLLIYALAIVIFIPINLYNGYFSEPNLLLNILKDIIFDGTLYHLWYLPASILGASIAWLLAKKLGVVRAIVIASVLYLIGLLGDSYFALTESLPILSSIYDLFFKVSDYTRNGLFFAPLFFLLGSLIAERQRKGQSKPLSLRASVIGLTVCFALMCAESFALHALTNVRHDSMYLSLPLCSYFLFCTILCPRGRRLGELRDLSLTVYIIHPMMIVAVRFAAKLLGLERLFVDNSLVHFLSVCAASILFGVILNMFKNKLLNKGAKGNSALDKKEYEHLTDRAYIEIDLAALEHNVEAIRASLPEGCEIMAVVKAQGYGHGMCEISQHLLSLGVKAFAVATVDEAIELRRCGTRGEILVLGYTSAERAEELEKYSISQIVIDADHARALAETGIQLKLHIKIDSGMHRLGFDASDTDGVARLFDIQSFDICGIFTHLSTAEDIGESDTAFAKEQIARFYALLDALTSRGISLPPVHIQSSYGLLNYPELKCSYVRAGLAIYGILGSEGDRVRLELDLRPVLSLRSRIVSLRDISEGDTVGYGRAFVAERDTKIAMVPIGYADGYPRSLSCGKGEALVRGVRVKVIGKICMDQLAIDVTDISDVAIGDTVTLIGKDGDARISVEEVASRADTITNEIVSRLGERLKTVIK